MIKIFISLLFLPLFAFSQIKLDTINKNIYYSEVFEVLKPKEYLHQKASEWIAINFKDSKEVIKLDTPDKIIVKGFFYYNSWIKTGEVFFILEIGFKEKKYKVDFNNFEIQNNVLVFPMYYYFKVNSMDDYIKMVENQRTLSKSKFLKKYLMNLLNNPKRLNKRYIKFRTSSKIFKTKFSNQIIGYAKSLNTYISKNTSDGW